MKLFRFVISVFAFVFLLVSIGCEATTSTIDPTSTISTPYSPPTLSPTPAIEESTLILTSTPLPSSTPTKTIAPVPDVSSTAMASPDPTQTTTPWPTLSPDTAEAFVLALLQGNDDCLLPCWWGTIPGETTWQETEPFLSSFVSEIIPLTSLRADNPLVTYEVHVKVPEHISPVGDIRLFYTVRDNIIEDIEVELGNSLNYLLPQVLATYGEPSEVWLSTYSHSRDNNLPFRTVLLYLDKGFIAGYFDDADEVSGEITGCPQQSSYQFANLWLWSPERELSFDEMFGKTTLLDKTQLYLSLQEATEIDTKSFYETFKDSNNTTCLKTSADLWPSP